MAEDIKKEGTTPEGAVTESIEPEGTAKEDTKTEDSSTQNPFVQYQQIRSEVDTQQAQRTWQNLSDNEINQIISQPLLHGQYLPSAIEEKERRLASKIFQGVSRQLGEISVKAKYPEAFKEGTPLNKEIQRLTSNRSVEEVYSDIVELANFKLGKSSIEKEARKKVIDNIRATDNTPGIDSTEADLTPKWSDMSREELNKRVSQIKLSRS